MTSANNVHIGSRGVKRSREHPGEKQVEKRPSMDGRNDLIKLREINTNMEFEYCHEVTKFEKLAKIGQGTFGEVFKVRSKKDGKTFAIKKILMESEAEGFPITALREIKILQVLKHPNIVDMVDVVRSKPSKDNQINSSFYLVFEFCEHDLAGLLSSKRVVFSLGEIKMVAKQLLDGLFFMHTSKILHRDIKSSNILITKSGILKIADFGLSRSYSTCNISDRPKKFTNRVVTLWYRPPELLLGERNYGPAIDMWGAGCIMAELWTRTPIMQGKVEQEQLELIVRLCGSITPEVYEGVTTLALYNQMVLPRDVKRQLKSRLKGYVTDAYGLDLIDKLLTIDPAKRIDSDTALMHDFFWQDPLPCSLEKMLQSHTRSMFEYLRADGQAIEKHQGAGHYPRPNPVANDEQYRDRVF